VAAPVRSKLGRKVNGIFPRGGGQAPEVAPPLGWRNPLGGAIPRVVQPMMVDFLWCVSPARAKLLIFKARLGMYFKLCCVRYSANESITNSITQTKFSF
jgi:hypothetical protein